MDSDQQERFAEAVERKKQEADAASKAPHEEHADDGPVSGAQTTTGDSTHDGVMPAGQKGGAHSKRWNS
jgi:hypothetical protein